MEIKFEKSDLKLLLLYFLFAIPISLEGNNYPEDYLPAILDTLVYVSFSLIGLFIVVYVLFPRFLPKGKIFQLFFAIAILFFILGVIEIYCYKFIEDQKWNTKNIFKILMYGFYSSLENLGILIGLFLGKKFYDAQIDIQKRETEKRESELRLLKSQIDPHFLFNNLNTVDSLIDTNPAIAKEYLNKLSQLYRYLIRTKDDEVVLLQEELEFANNYTYLLQKRFGSAFEFDVKVDEEHLDKFIPPGALQTLLENVVKHNIGSESDPIKTSIISKGDNIIVTNDIKRKLEDIETTGTGLNNLKARYKLLTDKELSIISENEFVVSLPLIKSI